MKANLEVSEVETFVKKEKAEAENPWTGKQVFVLIMTIFVFCIEGAFGYIYVDAILILLKDMQKNTWEFVITIGTFALGPVFQTVGLLIILFTFRSQAAIAKVQGYMHFTMYIHEALALTLLVTGNVLMFVQPQFMVLEAKHAFWQAIIGGGYYLVLNLQYLYLYPAGKAPKGNKVLIVIFAIANICIQIAINVFLIIQIVQAFSAEDTPVEKIAFYYMMAADFPFAQTHDSIIILASVGNATNWQNNKQFIVRSAIWHGLSLYLIVLMFPTLGISLFWYNLIFADMLCYFECVVFFIDIKPISKATYEALPQAEELQEVTQKEKIPIYLLDYYKEE
jgi:hypothetical protein